MINRQFTAYDGNGNVTGLADSTTGKWSARYEYGPFGEVIRATGPACGTNPFRFSTKYQDDETDLLYYGYRYYSASTGRWLSRDPLEEELGGVNLYSFVGNNGVDSCDVFGLQKFEFLVMKNDTGKNNHGTVNDSGDWGSPGSAFTGSATETANSASTTVTGIMHGGGHCCNTVVSKYRDKEPGVSNADAGSILVFMTDAAAGTYTVNLDFSGEAHVTFAKDDNGDLPSGNAQAILQFRTSGSQVMYGRVAYPKGPFDWAGTKSGTSTVVTKRKSDRVLVGKYNLTMNMNACAEVTLTATGSVAVTGHSKIK